MHRLTDERAERGSLPPRESNQPPPIAFVDHRAAPSIMRDESDMTGDPDIGRRIDRVHQHVRRQLADTFPNEEPLVLIGALAYEIVRLVETFDRCWTPKALDRFLVDFTRVLRRRVLAGQADR